MASILYPRLCQSMMSLDFCVLLMKDTIARVGIEGGFWRTFRRKSGGSELNAGAVPRTRGIITRARSSSNDAREIQKINSLER